MFSLPATLKSIQTFVRDEDGMVAVDFVVMTGAATGMAMATMAAFSSEIGWVSDEVAAGSQHRDSRPSYAYRAHDPEAYQRFAASVSSLDTGDLAVLSAWGNNTRRQLENSDDASTTRFFEDFDQAITLAYANRQSSRDTALTEYDDYDLERVSRMLGLGGQGSSL